MSSKTDPSRDVTALYNELLRTEYVWGNFIHNLCHNLNPERIPGSMSDGQFEGTAEDRLLTIFKIMDGQVRHIRKTLTELGFHPPQYPPNSEEIYDEVARGAELTTV